MRESNDPQGVSSAELELEWSRKVADHSNLSGLDTQPEPPCTLRVLGANCLPLSSGAQGVVPPASPVCDLTNLKPNPLTPTVQYNTNLTAMTKSTRSLLRVTRPRSPAWRAPRSPLVGPAGPARAQLRASCRAERWACLGAAADADRNGRCQFGTRRARWAAQAYVLGLERSQLGEDFLLVRGRHSAREHLVDLLQIIYSAKRG